MSTEKNVNVVRFIGDLPVATITYDDESTIIESGAKVSLSSDYPEGELLVIRYPGEKPQLIDTYKLIEYLVYKTAKIYALQQKSNVSNEYQHLLSHFSYKTGLFNDWRKS